MPQVQISLTDEGAIDIPHGRVEGLVGISGLPGVVGALYVRVDDTDNDTFPQPLANDDGMFGLYLMSAPAVPIQNLFKVEFEGITGSAGAGTIGGPSTALHAQELEVCGFCELTRKLYLMNSFSGNQAIFKLGWDVDNLEFVIEDFAIISSAIANVPQCLTILNDGTFLVGEDNSNAIGGGGTAAVDTMDVYEYFPDFLTGGSYSAGPIFTFEFHTPATAFSGESRGFDMANDGNLVYCTFYEGLGSAGVSQKRGLLRAVWDGKRLDRYYQYHEADITLGIVRGVAIVIDAQGIKRILVGENPTAPTTDAITIFSEPANVVSADAFMGRSYLEGDTIESASNTGDNNTVSVKRTRAFPGKKGEFIVFSEIYATSVSTGASTKECNLALFAAEAIPATDPQEFKPIGEPLYIGQPLVVPARGATDPSIQARTIQQAEFFALDDMQYIPSFFATGPGAGTNALFTQDVDGVAANVASKFLGPPAPPIVWDVAANGGGDSSMGFGIVTTLPIFPGVYSDQVSAVGDGIFFDVSQGWANFDRIEIASIPPDFTFNEETFLLEGEATTNMDYTIYVRGVNESGVGDWEPLNWVVTGATSARKLWGLSFDFQEVIAALTPANVFIKQGTVTGRQTTWNAGLLLINDVDDEGSASKYDSSFVNSQILNDKVAATLMKSTEPGWEIIVDTDLG